MGVRKGLPKHRDNTRLADRSTLGTYWGGSYTDDPNWHQGNVWHTHVERRQTPAHRQGFHDVDL